MHLRQEHHQILQLVSDRETVTAKTVQANCSKITTTGHAHTKLNFIANHGYLDKERSNPNTYELADPVESQPE